MEILIVLVNDITFANRSWHLFTCGWRAITYVQKFEIALINDITAANRSWFFTRQWRICERNWNRVSRHHFPKSIMTLFFQVCLHVDDEDVNEIEIGRLKRKVKLPDTIAEREEICHEFSERCKEVCCLTFFNFDAKRFVSPFYLWNTGLKTGFSKLFLKTTPPLPLKLKSPPPINIFPFLTPKMDS